MQTGRRGGDGHRGGEDSCGRGGTETGGVWDERGRQSNHSRPCSPTFTQINREGRTQSGGERGRQSGGEHPAAPHSCTDKSDKWLEAKQTAQPRDPARGNKASDL